MSVKNLLAVLALTASAHAQMPGGYMLQEWMASDSGTWTALIQRPRPGEDDPSVIYIWMRNSVIWCDLPNAPQDVETDTACNIQTNAHQAPGELDVSGLELLAAATRSLAWFVDNTPIKPKPKPRLMAKHKQRAQQVTRTSSVSIAAQNYLGGRL